ncbi:MAG TPA: aminoglycoside phosphotransferase family protein [Segetibacter sp.]|nr:aminoglycoside phosphotransferase family protein [Segetibacter sp.]
MLGSILSHFGINEEHCSVHPFGSGLINNTWKIADGERNFILQRINDHVFKQPENIAHNIRLISNYFQEHFPAYLFTSPVQTIGGDDLVYDEVHGYFRLFPFVEASHTVDTVQTPEEAYEAAKQFGKFTKLLSGLDISQLAITLPDFHNLSLRYEQFQQALAQGSSERIAQSSSSIAFLQQQIGIVKEFESIKKNPGFKIRVTHHDTKISNILFDENNLGLCVIDLDTVMPGYFISDVGDMMRTYLSPVSEEEKDFSKIEVRDELFEAIVRGYLHDMNDELSAIEKNYFVYAGKFLIYMQALRFLTDYFNNDVYYGSKYPQQNFVRATNQIVLLQKLLEKEEKWKKIF